MIYPDIFEQKIEFDKIRSLLKQLCLSELGKDFVSEMTFSSQYEDILFNLDCTSEFKAVLESESEFPTAHFYDLRTSINRIRIAGTFLDEKELFELVRSLETIKDIVIFFRQDEEIIYPSLHILSNTIAVFPDIIKYINNILNKFGKIKDNASPELARIRKEISSTQNSISHLLSSILKKAQSEGYTDSDLSPTLRDGRLVIPIHPSYKRKIKGIVHDESASGKTVFIEPEAAVEANNRIYELQGEERREIIRILIEVANFLRPHNEDLCLSYRFLGKIDFIRAKALFAIQTDALKPVVENQTYMDWYQARHPLLFLSLKKQHKQIVPLNIRLTGEDYLLIISGPNAGGKSVCLKTAGMLQYMMQCGMLIPLQECSKMGIFNNIFIDIGDEQSIENDLSTYSSHLTNMKFFAKHCNDKTLLLIDEFGTGTEPQIGGAIAEALLNRFNEKKSWGIITTHYTNLKLYAEQHVGTINGAMLYDRHEMRPLFQLQIGNAGSSFAIEIARKIGLPEEIIAEASEKVGSDYVNIDKYLQDIVRDKRYWEVKRQNIRKQEKQLEDTINKYESELQEIHSTRKDVLRSAKSEAKQLLENANAQIENTIRKIKESQAEKEKTRELRKEFATYKKEVLENSSNEPKDPVALKIKQLEKRDSQKNKNSDAVIQQETALQAGDVIRIKNKNTIGEILDIRNNKAVIAIGNIKSTAPLDSLEKVNRKELKNSRKSSFISSHTNEELRLRKLNFNSEIDIRGMRGEDALQAVMYFIDDALIIGINSVRILHGTGTGILRELTRNYLSSVSGIRSFHDEHVQLGGAGITVVEF